MTDFTPQTPGSETSTPTAESASLPDKAADAAQAAKQATAEVAQTAMDKSKDVVQETTKQARDLLGEARSQLQQQASSQHRSLVENLCSLDAELASMSQHREQPGVATELVSQAHRHVRNIANWLDQREPADLVQELRAFARRRPGAFLVGAALGGVAAGRLTRGVVAAHTEDDSATTHPATPAPAAVPANITDYDSPQGVNQMPPATPVADDPATPAAYPGLSAPGYPLPPPPTHATGPSYAATYPAEPGAVGGTPEQGQSGFPKVSP